MQQIQQNLADKTLIDYSNTLTTILLQNGLKIDTVCLCVKEYQRKYVHIREEGASPELLKAYTPEKWWRTCKVMVVPT